MSYKTTGYKKLVSRSLPACLGSLFISALGSTSVLAQATSAQSSGTQQAKPTLSDLINTVPVRPTVAQPATGVVDSEPAVQDDNTQPVRLLLRLSERRVYVYRGNIEEASYPVAIGRSGWETPTGSFSIFSQLVDPGWTHPLTGEVMPPGPDNPLGDRWIGFWTDGTNAIGFHGTPTRDSVGRAASHGCVRMYNEDVSKLYDIVAIGTPVVVEP